MSEKPDESTPQEPVTLSKGSAAKPAKDTTGTTGGTGATGAAGGAGATDAPAPLRRPRSIELASLAAGAYIVLSIAQALSFLGFTDQLKHLLIDSNNKAKPKKPYTAAQIAHDLHQFRTGQLIQGIVLALALAFLVAALRRPRSATAGRWALPVVMILTSGGPLALIPQHDWPGVPATLRVIMGVAATAAIVLLFVPDSSRYFRDLRASLQPAGTAAATPRPGLRDLFAPRGPRTPAPGRATRPAQTRPASGTKAPAGSATSNAKAKAKVRSDEAAVAKGAELARSRAKAASKSRRTET